MAASSCARASEKATSTGRAAASERPEQRSVHRIRRVPLGGWCAGASSSDVCAPSQAKTSSRTACSSSCVQPNQSCNPRAWAKPATRRSRARSTTAKVAKLVATNCSPVSRIWWASSNTTTSTAGSNSAMPPSFRARSAKNRWWLTTTRSAAMAWRRACITWQSLKAGHSLPRQFSRVEVIKGTSAVRSSSPGTSDKSPLAVLRAQSSTRANRRRLILSRPSGACRAWARRWRHR